MDYLQCYEDLARSAWYGPKLKRLTAKEDTYIREWLGQQNPIEAETVRKAALYLFVNEKSPAFSASKQALIQEIIFVVVNRPV